MLVNLWEDPSSDGKFVYSATQRARWRSWNLGYCSLKLFLFFEKYVHCLFVGIYPLSFYFYKQAVFLPHIVATLEQ